MTTEELQAIRERAILRKSTPMFEIRKNDEYHFDSACRDISALLDEMERLRCIIRDFVAEEHFESGLICYHGDDDPRLLQVLKEDYDL